MNIKETAKEFKNMGLDENSQVYKDTAQGINGELDESIDETQTRIDALDANEKAIVDKNISNKKAIESDTINELQKIDVDLQVAQLEPYQIELDELRAKYKNIIYNLDDKKELEKAKSDKLKFGKVCSRLEKSYTELSEPVNEVRNKLLSKRAQIRDDLRELQAGIADQIKKHVDAKKQHLIDLQSKLTSIMSFIDELSNRYTSHEIGHLISNLQNVIIDDSYEHLQEEAIFEKDRILTELQNKYDETLQNEKDKKELEDLRELKRLQEQKDHEKRIADEAVKNAKIESDRIAQDIIDKAKIESDNLLLKAKQDLIDAENEKIAALQLVKDNEMRARLKVENDKRLAQERIDIENARIKREKEDKEEQKILFNTIVGSLLAECKVTDDIARDIAKSIIKGCIERVSVSYLKDDKLRGKK